MLPPETNGSQEFNQPKDRPLSRLVGTIGRVLDAVSVELHRVPVKDTVSDIAVTLSSAEAVPEEKTDGPQIGALASSRREAALRRQMAMDKDETRKARSRKRHNAVFNYYLNRLTSS
jgi:hypothetical protein